MVQSTIPVRAPRFDLSETPVVWGSNPEAVMAVNAGSPIITPIEVFLIKVLNRARAELDPVADAELVADMDAFNKQEGQHYRTHAGFNKLLREYCPAIAAIEDEYSADMERFLETKSLSWLLGYCEGFEAVGGLHAENWVDGFLPELTGGAGTAVVAMFQWHLAEEYEHRTVAFRLFERLYDGPPELEYVFRIKMFLRGTRHFGGYIERVRRALLATYREGMTETELARSKEQEAETGGALKVARNRTLGPVFGRGYDPARTPPPRHEAEILALYPVRV
jgi:predicted metal-dependent hydrolase